MSLLSARRTQRSTPYWTPSSPLVAFTLLSPADLVNPAVLMVTFWRARSSRYVRSLVFAQNPRLIYPFVVLPPKAPYRQAKACSISACRCTWNWAGVGHDSPFSFVDDLFFLLRFYALLTTSPYPLPTIACYDMPCPNYLMCIYYLLNEPKIVLVLVPARCN